MGASSSTVYYKNARDDIDTIREQLRLYKSDDFVLPLKPELKLKLPGMIELSEYKLQTAFRIYQAIKYGHDRLLALTKGPRCDGSPEYFTREECDREGARWVPFTTTPDKHVRENAGWFRLFNMFQHYYTKELKGSSLMIRQLTRANNMKLVKQIETRSLSKIPMIIQRTNQLYQMVLFTPTHTKASAEAMYEKYSQEASAQEAMKAAIIASRTDHR